MDELGFLQNEMAQDAVIRNFEVIGEACRNIERDHADFVAAHPELPLSFAYEMRNALAHGYFKVDLGIVWKTVENDLASLHQQVRTHQQDRALVVGADHDAVGPHEVGDCGAFLQELGVQDHREGDCQAALRQLLCNRRLSAP